MDEIFQICDEVTVLRDGKLIMTKDVKETSMDELIKSMVGRSLENRFPVVDNKPGKVILEIKNLTTKFEPKLDNINLSVKKGEIFGLYGLVGAGRSEFLETLFGLRTIGSGEIVYDGKLRVFKNSRDAMNNGFAMVTEERKFNGMFAKSDLVFNTTIANMNEYTNFGVVSDRLRKEATDNQLKILRTKCSSCYDLITALSGGNQQKVIIGKWLTRDPDILLLDEPTRGIDVGAKYEIYQLIIQMAKQGKTCIVVSSEMPEILGITNRIAIMSNYKLSGIVDTKSTTQEELLKLSVKHL